MTYQEFKTNTIQVISNKLGSNFQVTLQDILKNNDTHLDGLTILANGCNLSPTIYLNPFYEQYLEGRELDAIYDEILFIYNNHTPKGNIDISFFTDYEKVKERIVFKLVNYERNKELLKKVPHIRYLDLALIFNCLLDSSREGFATILIYHHHLSFWHITVNELYELAVKNTPRLLHYHIENMADIISDIISAGDPCLFEHSYDPLPMYILSNKSKLNGSGCILYENLLAQISAKLHSDLYILPSSIHEVLLIPTNHSKTSTELTALVEEVNSTQLLPEEILSDHVYHYSLATGKISMQS